MKRRAQPWLGTLVEITIADTLDDNALNRCFDRAFSAVADVHRLMSFHDPASDVSRINRALVGEPVLLHPYTREVLRTALSVSEASCGIFDIACAPRLVECGHLPWPDGEPVDFLPGSRVLVLEEADRIWKRRPLWIDLGGIAKGYAVDLAVAALQSNGIRSACINAGGDLRVLGQLPYPISIRNPRAPAEISLQVDLQDAALATSANYFSGHATPAQSVLFDGRNGQACPGDFSVSVQASACMLADALTKVVAASGNACHPALAHFGATAFII